MKYNVTCSGQKTSTTQIVAGSLGGMLHGVILLPDGTNASSVVVYNDVSNTSGLEVAVLSIAAATTAPQQIIFSNPVMCPNGIRAVLAGTGGKVIVYYSPGA